MHSRLIYIVITVIAIIVLGACNTLELDLPKEDESDPFLQNGGMRMMMGPGSGMMNRHHAQVPDEYAGLTNPVPMEAESLARGQDIYNVHCAICHGDYGNGDGPGGENLDPAPAPIAHTSQMMGDAYLFWRISEGGLPFRTGMIPYANILDDQERWDVINYVRAIGSGSVKPDSKMGGEPFDP